MACDVFTCANFLFCSASVLNLCAISWDRYVAVTSPLRYCVIMRDANVFRLIAFCWSSALICSAVFTKLMKNSINRIRCSIKGLNLEYSVTSAILLYFVPVCFLVFVNGRVIKIAHSQKKRVRNDALPGLVMEHLNKKKFYHNKNIRSRREMKILRMFLIISVGVILCWSPLQIVIVMEALVNVPGNVLYFALLMAYINSAFNPFLYGVYSRDIRKSIMQKVCCKSS